MTVSPGRIRIIGRFLYSWRKKVALVEPLMREFL
jgi:hypothetical protein